MSNETCRWVTARPLLFNDPERGKVVSIPAGEPCSLLDSLEALAKKEASAGSLLRLSLQHSRFIL